ncbi:alpha/beta fold hydrolase [Aureimonas phyllosphaerae]|uniref:Pimeloyl-ACP methyl ester carboxylesterase n=1 Tax=Aureimonas phyllosphaerae TaxID=1166078 RepID=A0A7W6BMB0_9HYPH|nr:alpha/beta hydrolase [Aureimonas phyllosphaerae]MBB3934594.1 pimeloyl-ACP methyl ester carboxylesterase [Aureimonas phyllosphaerae]MBB3958190.1 pimeloyl-ACP methyl ester carboxylesterase [Aureimonas phyllosphaerae]SFE93235.1 Pimeloyl-ACP methyl ester carboxylesterase [Aureimonas phyllosphaerae]
MEDDFAPTHRTIHCNGLRLHVVQAGPASGPPVVLLHGFPDFWIGWRPQMKALAEAGFRVIVPDQRGYNLSDKPKGVGAYALPKLVGDVLALSDALGHERFDLVGHDWGGIVAWTLAAKAPHRLRRLAILNAPHPEALFPHALRSPTQFLRSGYAAFFQFPLLPEAVLGARRFAVMVRALRQTGRPDAFTSADLDLYREAWSRPGALTGMLNWYRALRLRPRVQERITVPTLILWGLQDTALERGLADRSLRFCDNRRLETFRDATHWLHREEPGRVNAALLSFLKS